MKILFLADIHFHNYKPFSHMTDQGENSRLIDICNTIDAAFEIADEHLCTHVCVAGDIFHTRGSLKPSVIARAKKVFSDRHQEVIMIPGNHDMEFYKGGYTALEVFQGMSGVGIYEYPQLIAVGKKIAVVIPYIHDVEEFKRQFNSLKPHPEKDIAFIMIHQGIDDPESDIPPSGINPDFLCDGHNATVFAGHYHGHKIYNDGQCIQIGAPLQHSFSDIGSERGCLIFDTDIQEAVFYPISVAPKFVEIDKLTKKIEKEIAGNFIRINAKTEASARKIMSQLDESGIESIVKLEKDFKTAHEASISIDSPLKMLSEYIDLQEDMKPLKTEILALFEELSTEA